MANSRFAYVRNFELQDRLLPATFLLLRIDGHSFHRFSDVHAFDKPNDVRALRLMDRAALHVMQGHPDIILAFGESDEYSFLMRRATELYNRRSAKIVSTITSLFTSAYMFHWHAHFPVTPLAYPPSFDGRIVLYPAAQQVKDYFAWRQADTHVNNLYNTTFWALVHQGGLSTTDAHSTLKGTLAKDKNEILFKRFGINYNSLDARFRKGSVLIREVISTTEAVQAAISARRVAYTASRRSISSSFEHVDKSSTFNDLLKDHTSSILHSENEILPGIPSTSEFPPLPSDISGLPSALPIPGQALLHAREQVYPLAQDQPDQISPSLSPAPEEIPLPMACGEPPSTPLPRSTETSSPLSKNTARTPSGLNHLRGTKKEKKRSELVPETHIVVEHCDIIREDFWAARPWLLKDDDVR